MQISTKGIVIRERSINDDRLVTLLTEEHGVLNAFARGARKPKSKLASTTELFCYCRLGLFQYKDSYTVDTAELDTSFFELRQDIMKLSLASYIAELMGELAPKEEEAREYLRLILNTLHLIQKGSKPQALIKAAYELRLLTMAGFMPDLVCCRECGRYESDPMFFFPSTGELSCQECHHAVDQGAAVALGAGVLAAMRHILYSDFSKLFSFTVTGDGLKGLGEICECYLLNQVQKKFLSLEFYHSLL